MLTPICPSCGHILANLEIPFEEGISIIENNKQLTSDEKATAKKELIDKLLPLRWKKRYCCRQRLISYVDLIKVVI